MDKDELKVIREKDKYLVFINGQSYELSESQCRAIVRKKNMPIERLEVWIRAYMEENEKMDELIV